MQTKLCYKIVKILNGSSILDGSSFWLSTNNKLCSCKRYGRGRRGERSRGRGGERRRGSGREASNSFNQSSIHLLISKSMHISNHSSKYLFIPNPSIYRTIPFIHPTISTIHLPSIHPSTYPSIHHPTNYLNIRSSRNHPFIHP